MSRLLPLLVALALTACATSAPAPTPKPSPWPEGSIEAFVTHDWMHGVPFEHAKAFDATHVPRLLELLDHPDFADHRTTIVITLGMIGPPSVQRPLIALLEAPAPADGPIPDAAFRARAAVPLALGYLIHRTGDPDALRYLADGLATATWEARCTGWRSPWHEQMAQRNAHLRQMAVLGLALAGTPEAAAALRDARDRAEDASFAGACEAALEEHERVGADGVETYDRSVRPQPDTPSD